MTPVPKQRMIHRYLAWRKTISLVWRIVADIVVVAVVVFLAITALQMLILLLPFLAFLGFAGSGSKSNSDDQWYEENQEGMGGEPRSMAPDLFD